MTRKGKGSISVPALTASAIGSLLLTTGAAHAKRADERADTRADTRAGTRADARADRPTTVPPHAFLQPTDLDGAATRPADPQLRPALRPPQPCLPGGLPSVGARYAGGAVTAVYPVTGTRPTVLLEDIGLFEGSAARDYLRELRHAVASCSGATDETGTWSVLDRRIAGWDSLLLRLETTVDVEGSVVVQHMYILVARVGRAVVVLADLGWEAGDGHEGLVRSLARAAVRRVRTLR